MKAYGKNYTAYFGIIMKATDKAVLLQQTGEGVISPDEIWIPRSQCYEGDELDMGDNEVFINDWWVSLEDYEKQLEGFKNG